MSKTDATYSFNSFWKENLPTRNLLIIILVVYVITSILSMLKTGISSFSDLFTISNEILIFVGENKAMVYHGYVYQLLSSIFVHVNVVHLLSNCLFLIIYGLRAEDRLFNWQYYLIFLSSAFAGSLLSLFVFDETVITAGASGGIFGLLGLNLVLSHEEDNRKSLWSYLGTGLIFLVLSGGMNVNILAHAIGLLVGVILPLFFIKKRKKRVIIKSETSNHEIT
ncbi:MAG: rhomboid family intramembrane serine protease [Candidatus Heimdallarchaeaceae archaeon]